MAYKTSYELHHHFPKVAEESGFTFNTHRPRVHLDWNKIRLIDVDSLVKERKFIIIEQHLNDILDCVLESEFDVRILDEGVLKLFRLAQLAVEYQQFCRHYLDRSVYVLRQEITSLAQELDINKKNLRDTEEELRKLRKINKHTQKKPLSYGNDNIAAMILKTLSTKGVIFPTFSNSDIHEYNKCNYCDKVFLNQLYLQSHISRRHPNVTEISQKETQSNDQYNENIKLSDEITELRNKLKEMETFMASTKEHIMSETVREDKSTYDESSQNMKINMKDAGVSTNSENYFLDKFEEWKKVERVEYNKEINKLRNQIMEMINSFKQKEKQEYTEKDSKLIEQFNATIIQQGAEILVLKKELDNSKIRAKNEHLDRSQDTEEQISLWAKRTEAQSKQYELLLQKLNDVAKDAKESRALAMAEREKSAQLQTMLEQSPNKKVIENINHSTDAGKTAPVVHMKPAVGQKQSPYKSHIIENKTIENLQRKAQELLNIGSSSSSSSDVSSMDKIKPVTKLKETENKRKFNAKSQHPSQSDVEERPEQMSKSQNQPKTVITHMRRKSKEKNRDLYRANINIDKQNITGSPIKVVRAKLTEEVNNRLVVLGIDPLKCRLPHSVYQNQRMQLQQLRDLNSKKSPAHEKIRHSLLAHLDSSTANPKIEDSFTHDYVSPNKVTKPFRNITSVISGVKSKALSLVKLNDTQLKDKRKSLGTEVAKRALSLLKTPPGSASNSPQRKTVSKTNIDSVHELHEKVNVLHPKTKYNFDSNRTSNKLKKSIKYVQEERIANSTSESSNDSDQYDSENIAQKSSKSIENLIKSPARRPSSVKTDYKQSVKKYVTDDTNNFMGTQSAINSNDIKTDSDIMTKLFTVKNIKNIDDIGFSSTAQLNKATSDENISKQNKGVLKNASSTSTLNKKKVIFDMDAIQMKSLSASPSQSVTEKNDSAHNYELGLVNLDGEEWDISSIENEPLRNDTKLQFRTSASPKIAELKQQIESQLARRASSSATGFAGAVDVLGLGVPVPKATSIGGSNTSLGSSILDESETVPAAKRKIFINPKVIRKDDSDLDASDFSLDGIIK